jgi:ribosomal protein L11 methyltransferase
LSYALPEHLEEDATAALWSAGTLGVQIAAGDDERLRIDAYFDPAPGDPLSTWRELGVDLLATIQVEESDWLEPYRRLARPQPVGRGFIVDAREPGSDPAPDLAGRTLLRLPARRAFGTGSHATTRLLVELLESRPPRGQRVLDVGTGSGILSFIALHLGAAVVVACDNDLVAAFLAVENMTLNGRRFPLYVGTPAALVAPSRFDLLLANVLPGEIAADLAALERTLLKEGEALFSGIPADAAREVAARLGGMGLVVVEERGLEEWVALRAVKA